MATGVNVKMGVSGISQFKQGMNQAKQAAKTLDAQLSLTEKEFKATGDAEGYMAKKTEELKAKLEAQKSVVDNAQRALDQMAKNGVDRNSTAYQKLYQEMLKAKGELLDTENALNGVADAGDEAADKTSEMNAQLKRIGDGVNYQNVTSGLKTITDGIEGVIKKAWQMGEAIVRNTLGAGSWADELATEATKWGISTDELQRMRKTANLIDTDTDTILNAKSRLKKARAGEGKEVMGAFAALGIDPNDMKDAEDLFWRTGESLMALGDEYEQEAYAQKLFGKSWHDLVPLFKTGRQEYEETMASWSTVSEDQINSLTKMDDQYQKLTGEWETFRMTVLASLSETLTPLMEKLTDLMARFNEYIQSEKGQQMIQRLSDLLMGMFEDIMNIDPEKVMEGLIGIFNKIQEGLEWIINNKDTLVDALKVIAGGFGLLKLGTLATNVKKIYDGLKGLLGLGGGGGAEKAITGGLKTAIGNSVTGVTSKASAYITSSGLMNFLPFAGDWFAHTDLGMSLQNEVSRLFGGGDIYGVGGVGDWWEREKDTVSRNAETFSEDWQNNVVYKAVKGFFDQQRAASEWILGDDATAEDAMAFVEHQTWLKHIDSVVDQLLGDRTNDNKATSEMTAAANNMQGLPAAIETAVRNGVSNIRVYIDGQLVSNSVGSTMANAIAGLVR